MGTNNGGMAVWDKVANNNAGADNTLTWAEGMAPSAVNNSARAMMASAAKWRDDVSGALLTTGTSVAYQIAASNQNFVNITDLANQVIAFTVHLTNGQGPVTLSIDGFANLPLRSAPGIELPAGVLIAGTPYVALYNNTDHALYLQNFYGASPYLIPLGAMLDFTGTTAPNSNFVLPFGQAISRTAYAAYFAMVGTAYGAGDGTTTFNVPDLRGRFTAAPDGMGGTLAGRLNATGGMNGVGIGAVGGAQTHILTAGEIPSITSTVSTSGTLTGATASSVDIGITPSSTPGGGFGINGVTAQGAAFVSVNGTLTGTATSNNTGGAAHTILPPTIVVNKILRVL